MKKIAIMTFAFIVSLSAGELEKEDSKVSLAFNYPKQQEICVANITDVNRRGCCSRHGGVCGCEGKRVKCCDDTLSPTCKCGE